MNKGKRPSMTGAFLFKQHKGPPQHKYKKPPPSKGRWVLRSKTRKDCLYILSIYQLFKMIARPIPQSASLRSADSPLCTRGPVCAVQKLPLLGVNWCFAIASFTGEPFYICAARLQPGRLTSLSTYCKKPPTAPVAFNMILSE